METPIRLALVEDVPMLRRRLLDRLAQVPDFVVMVHAGTAEELLAQLSHRSSQDLPDIVLMDIGLPGMDGVEATRLVRGTYPAIEVLMLTVSEAEDKLYQSVLAGASGYLLKDEAPEALEQAIRELKSGGAPMSPLMARKLLALMRTEPAGEATDAGGKGGFDLTDRELEILRLLVSGQNYNQVGDALSISPQTVRSHIKNIYKKMHVHNRADAVRIALKTKTV